MTSVEKHASHVAALLEPALRVAQLTDDLPLLAALGRVTARPVLSPIDLPLFRNSQMDGFAVHSADVAGVPVRLPVVGDIPAGPSTPPPLAPGTAVRIMTGAVVPDGADCVVPVEDTELEQGNGAHQLEGATVVIRAGRASGDFVRDRASDLTAGDQLLPAGQLLGPRHLAALAAAGLTTVPVRRQVRVAVISTGSELVAPGDDMAPGQIFDSNLVALSAAVEETGAELVFAERSTDNLDVFRAILHRATSAADLVITSGGISEGAYEVVREVVGPLGATVGHVAMQPGGPQATVVVDGTPVLCFPGNPVSTQVSFALFARPLLLVAAGRDSGGPRSHPLATDLTSVAGKRQLFRGRFSADNPRTDNHGTENAVELVSGASSHLVAAMARAEVLIDIPAEVTSLRAGDSVRVWSL